MRLIHVFHFPMSSLILFEGLHILIYEAFFCLYDKFLDPFCHCDMLYDAN